MPTTNDIYSGTQLILYHFVYGGITLFSRTFQIISAVLQDSILSYQNTTSPEGFSLGYFLFVRHYLGNLN